MEPIILTSLSLGFTVGLMHAFDPDHLVAMSTMVSRERSIRRSSLLGAMWGLDGDARRVLGWITRNSLARGAPWAHRDS